MRIENISLSEAKVAELAQLSDTELKKWLKDQPIYKGIATSIRENKLKDAFNTIKRSQKQATKADPTAPARRGRKDNND
jgi:hypothetical protein